MRARENIRVGFRTFCRRAGLKITRQRAEVFGELARTDEHPDAAVLHRRVRRRLPSLSLDTVYRVLRDLERHRLVARVGGEGRHAHFDANPAPHQHFVCVACGRVLDFVSPAFKRLAPPPAARRLGTPLALRVEVRGLCRACLRTGGRRRKRRKEVRGA